MSESIVVLKKKLDEEARQDAFLSDGHWNPEFIAARKLAALNANPQLENFPFAEMTQ